MRAIATTLVLVIGAGVTFASMSVGLEGCAHVQKFEDDVKTCFGPDVKGDLGDIVKGIGTALICDLASGGGQIPACTIEGLQTIAEEIGPNGKKDVQCVVEKLATDAASSRIGASPEEIVRGQRAKLLVERGGLAFLRSSSHAVDQEVIGLGGSADRSTFLAEWGGVALGADPLGTALGDASTSPAKVTFLRGGPEAGHRAHNPSSRVQFSAPQHAENGEPAPGGAQRVPGAGAFAYVGPNPGAELAHCYRACGDNAHGAIAPPGGCECWRQVGSTWRWVAAR